MQRKRTSGNFYLSSINYPTEPGSRCCLQWKPGRMEYRGVWVEDGTELFRVGPIDEGTNNIGEFLAIVHALALLHKSGKPTPIYTDSVNALKWVAKRNATPN